MKTGILQISNGANAVTLKAPTLTSNIQLLLPATLPGSAQALQSDASGNLSFFAPITSVGLSAPVSLFSVANTPLTSNGTLSLTLASQSANQIFASPIGAAGSPSWRGLATTDFTTLPTLNSWAAPSAPLNLGGQTIQNVGTPVNPSDVPTKSYVDAISQGLQQKLACRYISIQNIPTIASAAAASIQSRLDTVGGSAPVLATGDRVLVYAQTNASENGIYTWNGTVLGRSNDANTNQNVVQGIYTFVGNGDTYGSQGFVLITPNPITLGTTALQFTEFSGAGDIVAGAGITKPSPNTLAVQTISSTRITSVIGGIDLAASGVVAGSYSGLTIDTYGRVTAATQPAYSSVYRAAFTASSLASNILTVTHNLGQQYVLPTISDQNNQLIMPDSVTFTSTTQLAVDLTSFNMGTAISGTWHVVVVG